jgi:uncharacterized membrane protein YraQ (UPF0718 family)
MDVTLAAGSPARSRRRVTWTFLWLGALGAFATFALTARAAELQTFALVLESIVIEALPFILLGSLVSAGLSLFAPGRLFEWIGRLPLRAQVPAVALSGFAFPVCECASVPVAKQLIRRGVHPSAGIAFMLAAPVVNPIVLLTTALAFSGRGVALQMVIARAGLGLATAITVGFASVGTDPQTVLRAADDNEHDHEHEGTLATRAGAALQHAVSDFFSMGRMIVFGATLAALFQIAVSQSTVSSAARIPTLAILAMMGLAFALSLCSEADAFVAASFLGFPLAAQLAFLTFGPVADFKLALLYGGTFRRDVVLRIIFVAACVVTLGSTAFWWFVR